MQVENYVTFMNIIVDSMANKQKLLPIYFCFFNDEYEFIQKLRNSLIGVQSIYQCTFNECLFTVLQIISDGQK